MNAHEQLIEKIKRLTVWLCQHRGRCFKEWLPWKIYRYVAWHLLNGTLFVAYDEDGIAMTFFAWLTDAQDVQARAAADQPQFDWHCLPGSGDSIFIAEVCGKRTFMPEILKQVGGVWPDSPRKRLFTYRRGRLVELTWQTIHRLTSRELT